MSRSSNSKKCFQIFGIDRNEILEVEKQKNAVKLIITPIIMLFKKIILVFSSTTCKTLRITWAQTNDEKYFYKLIYSTNWFLTINCSILHNVKSVQMYEWNTIQYIMTICNVNFKSHLIDSYCVLVCVWMQTVCKVQKWKLHINQTSQVIEKILY